MKINDVKHNHSLTDLLKVLIFSILMLIPFLDVGVRCGYVMLNKNAYQSYSDQKIETISQITNQNNMANGLTYLAVYQSEQGTNYSGNIGISYLSFTPTDYGYSRNDVIKFQASYYNGNLSLIFSDNTSESRSVLPTLKQFYFTFNSDNSGTTLYLTESQLYFYYESYTKNPLDNVFNYSVNKLTTSELYNWTTQTAIYTGVSSMTTQLGITGILIPMLVCYWFFITIIYIILDIVIKLFTMLTHAIGSKKA